MSTTFLKNSKSTQSVVGFDGKLSTNSLGLGQELRIADTNSAKKSPPGTMGTWRISAPAITKP